VAEIAVAVTDVVCISATVGPTGGGDGPGSPLVATVGAVPATSTRTVRTTARRVDHPGDLFPLIETVGHVERSPKKDYPTSLAIGIIEA
jgi:hypothetical protein